MGNNETGGNLPIYPKPDGPAINYGHPLAKALVFRADYKIATSTNHRDIVGGAPGTFNGTGLNAGPFGVHRTFLGATDQDAYVTAPQVNGLAAWTFEMMFKANVSGFSMLMSKGSGIDGGGEARIDINYGDTANCVGFGCGRATTAGSWRDTNGAFPLNKFIHLLLAYDGSSTSNVPRIWANGVRQPITQGAAPVGAQIADDTQLLVCGYPGQAFGATIDCEYAAFYNRDIIDAEARWLAADPWGIYQRPQRFFAGAIVGSIYSVSAAETATAAETVASQAVLPAAIAEAPSAVDSPSSVAVLPAAVGESPAAIDTTASVATLPAAVGETGTAADVVAQGAVFAQAVAETASPAEAVSAALVAVETVAETATLADIEASQAVLAAAELEAGSAADAPASAAVLPSVVSETGTGADHPASTAVLPGAMADALAPAEIVSSAAVLLAALVEAGNAQDTDALNPPIALGVVETATAQDTVSAVVVAVEAVAESAPPTDALASTAVLPAAIAESAMAADLVAAQFVFAEALVEAGLAVDLPAAIAILNTGIIESGFALDAVTVNVPGVQASKCNTLGTAPRIRVLGSAPRIRLLGGDCCP